MHFTFFIFETFAYSCTFLMTSKLFYNSLGEVAYRIPPEFTLLLDYCIPILCSI